MEKLKGWEWFLGGVVSELLFGMCDLAEGFGRHSDFSKKPPKPKKVKKTLAN
jgi:hypothetical protein